MSRCGDDGLGCPKSIRVVTLNCWGLKIISKYRRERLHEIGRQLAIANPRPQIVALQECWTQQDYLAVRDVTQHTLPYGKFYYSGFFGAGLAILSAWPIEESSMYAYPLNGRPAAFYRGDWYVGKGVACARIRLGRRAEDVVEVFCTHLHAPYEPEHTDSYACHRTAQAWEIAKLMRHAAERGHMVLGLGDFNMLPTSLAHRVIEAHSPARDVWNSVYPEDRTQGTFRPEAHDDTATAEERIQLHGTTCDSALNTWSWGKQMLKDLKKGNEFVVDLTAPDSKAKRLDYIFFADSTSTEHCWAPCSVNVGMIIRHPELLVSLSDHFSVEATFERRTMSKKAPSPLKSDSSFPSMIQSLPGKDYDEILDMIEQYMRRERSQRFWRLLHLDLAIAVSIACLGSIWRTDRNWLAFLLALISTIGLSAGVVDGLMGGLFVRQELRALKEFQWEVENARKLASST